MLGTIYFNSPSVYLKIKYKTVWYFIVFYILIKLVILFEIILTKMYSILSTKLVTKYNKIIIKLYTYYNFYTGPDLELNNREWRLDDNIFDYQSVLNFDKYYSIIEA